MKICAVVITYYPDVFETKKNVMQYLPYVDHLIVWENTPEIDRESYKITFDCYQDKISYLGTEKNEGISFALNHAIEWGKANSYSHILSMDQDSYFPDGAFFKYIDIIRDVNDKYDYFILGPNINKETDDSEIIKEKDHLITSGSVYPIDLFDKIGRFNENYFIDAVDFEISFRTIKNNGKILMATTVPLIHHLGYESKTQFGLRVNNYSSFRLYHIVRNNIWINKQYPDLYKPYRKGFWKKFIIGGIPKIILGEKDKLSKLKSIINGFIDGNKHNI